MMNEERPNYYAIIPAKIRYDSELKPNEKLLYGEITALTNKNGECWANNSYFANLYNVHINTASQWIQHLKDKGYIDTEITYKFNTKEVDKRVIKINGQPINKNIDTYIPKNGEGINKKIETPLNKNVEDNNTSINNTRLIKRNIKEKYFENEYLNNLFYEFLEFRKKLKAINSDKAINLLLNKLNQYDDQTKISMINQSIENSWKSVFPIKKKFENKREDKLPEWFDKELEVKEMSEDERRELEEIENGTYRA